MTTSARPPTRRSSSCSAGPSAEHDVSVVSGTAIAEALSDAGHDVEQVAHRSRRAAGGGCRRTIGAADRPAAAYDDPAGLGADGPDRAPARRSTGWPAAARRRSCSSPSTDRSARTGPSRRCSRRPAWPTPGRAWRRRRSAWTRPSSSGCAAASACRSSTGARSAPPAGRRARDAVLAELAAFAAGAGDPRLMVKPARLGQLGRDDPASTTRRAGRGARPGVPLRHARPRRDVPRRAPATSRSRSSATTTAGSRCSARARSCPATSSTTTPRSTRRACPRRSTRAEVPDATRQVAASRSPATPTGRSVPRASPGSTSCSPASAIYLSEINTIPGFTPISLFPTMPAEGGYTFADVCARIVDLALERHAARAGRAAHDRGPAAMSGRPARADGTPDARPDAPDASGPARLGRAVHRSGPARRWRCSSRAAAIYGVGASPAFDYAKLAARRASSSPTRRRSRRALAGGPWRRTCSG